MKAAACAFTVLVATAACGQEASEPRLRVSLSEEHSSVSNGNSAWDQQTVTLGRVQGRKVQELSLSHYRRFGQDDTELAGYLSGSLTPALTGWLQGSYSASHRVIAQSALAAGLQYEFAPSWLVHGGLHHAGYTANDVNRATLALEHYFGNFSLLAGTGRARALGRDTTSWELRGSYYYADDSQATLALGSGDEATQIAPGTLAIAAVRSVALFGRHRFTGGPWSLTWGAHHVRQGTFHTRTGGSVGVQYLF